MQHNINNITSTKIIMEILDNLYIPTFIKFILYPLLTLKNEIDCIINQRHPIKSFITCAFIVCFSFFSCYCFYNNFLIYNFYNNLTMLFNLNNSIQQIISFNIALLSFAHLGNYLGNIITKTFCKLFLGDANFYVTEKQLNKLIEQFHLQGYTNVNKTHVLEIIEFGKKNLTELHSNELGAKSIDWQQTLESLIYDANIEHFIDQQLALQNKKLEISNKIELIKYCKINEEDLHLSTITDRNANCPAPEVQENIVCYLGESFNMIQKEFDKFKKNYLKHHTCSHSVSGQQLLHQYQCYLNYREINTSMGIYPTASMEEILFNSFGNSYYSIYNSRENSRNNSVENTPHQTSLDSENSIIIGAQETQSEAGVIINPSSSAVRVRLS